MREQIKTQPTKFEIQRWFGPVQVVCEMPVDITHALIKMSDQIIEDKKAKQHGSSLAGVIHKELKVYKEDLEEAGAFHFLESCIRTYVQTVAESIESIPKDAIIKSHINSCWTVSQFANEYNPIHNHTGCQISAVLYLKTPDTKGRRNIPNKKDKRDSDGDISFIYNAGSERPGDIFEKGLVQFTPQAGKLLIFPSYLLHQVYPFIGEGERRSMAFNATYQIFKPGPAKEVETDSGKTGVTVGELIAGSESGIGFEKPYFLRPKGEVSVVEQGYFNNDTKPK
jgi:uncharacterized protein (TIGR02466 family)